MRFISPDPARQFFSPYIYGGGRPTIGVDPNGEFFWAPFIAFTLHGAYASYDISNGDWGATFQGALRGALTGATMAGLCPTPITFSSNAWLQAGADALSIGLQSGAQDALFQVAFRDKVDWGGVAKAAGMATAMRGIHYVGKGFSKSGLWQDWAGSKTGKWISGRAERFRSWRDKMSEWEKQECLGLTMTTLSMFCDASQRKRMGSTGFGKFADMLNYDSWITQDGEQGFMWGLFDLKHIAEGFGLAGLHDILGMGIDGRQTSVQAWFFYGFEGFTEHDKPWEWGDYYSDMLGAQYWNIIMHSGWSPLKNSR